MFCHGFVRIELQGMGSNKSKMDPKFKRVKKEIQYNSVL